MSNPEPIVRVRPLAETPALLDRAARMLARPGGPMPFTAAEAGVVAARMGLATFADGAQLIREGSERDTGHLLLLLDGEVTVDTGADPTHEGVPVSVLGPGEIIGEMALLDGAPRSASCTAAGPVQAAGLSRVGLAQIVNEHPAVAAKLMAMLAARIADRLRGMSVQLQMYAQLTERQADEIRRLKAGQAR